MEIANKTFDQERSLYHLQNASVSNCTFAGPADGESVLKECRHIAVDGCRFSLRYPLWHAKDFSLTNSSMDELTRAPIWYAADGIIKTVPSMALNVYGNVIGFGFPPAILFLRSLVGNAVIFQWRLPMWNQNIYFWKPAICLLTISR